MKTDLPGIDASEIQKCMVCGKGMMATGAIHFYEFSVSQCIVDMENVRQLHGMEVMMGAAAPLARVLAPTTTVAYKLPPVKKFVCQGCMFFDHTLLDFIEE